MSAVVRWAPLRRGIGLLEVAVVIFILVAIASVLLPQLGDSRETARGNTCRNNLRGIATALFNSGVRTGAYPGYMNVLQLQNGKVYSDPATGRPMPVSWVVMILPDIDGSPLLRSLANSGEDDGTGEGTVGYGWQTVLEGIRLPK